MHTGAGVPHTLVSRCVDQLHLSVRLWREPALLDRVRVAGGDVQVITPKPRETRGAPFGPSVQWLALEDRFAFYDW